MPFFDSPEEFVAKLMLPHWLAAIRLVEHFTLEQTRMSEIKKQRDLSLEAARFQSEIRVKAKLHWEGDDAP